MTSFTNNTEQIWYPAIAGLCALFVGIGLCRFAYTPLIPELINQDWLTKANAGYLATINFTGYLLGAFLAYRLSKHFEISFLIRSSLIISAMTLALCAIHFGFAWFSIWRFLAGVTGAFLMVLTPGIILKNIPTDYRGRVAGVIFTGNGLGTIVSGFLFPSLATLSMMMTWLTASFIAFLAISVSWRIFFKFKQISKLQPQVNLFSSYNKQSQQTLFALLAIAYALYGIGTVPHSLFLVDYIHHELGLNSVISGFFWSILGFGSLAGPFCAGLIADKVGTYRALIFAFIICCCAITMVLFNHLTTLYIVSSFLMGAFLPGIVTLISARIIEVVGADQHAVFWGKMTFFYAISQALGSYFMSYLLHQGLGYTNCFVIADFAFVLGLIMVAFAKEPLRHATKNNILSTRCTQNNLFYR